MGLKLSPGTPETIEFKDGSIFPAWTYCFMLER